MVNLEESYDELKQSLREDKFELNDSLRETKSKLNKLILALVSNPKIKLDYEKFTSFNQLDHLKIDDLKRLAKEIKKTQKIVMVKTSKEEKIAVINKFFNKISNVYKTGKYQEGLIAESLFNVKRGMGSGSDDNGVGGGNPD